MGTAPITLLKHLICKSCHVMSSHVMTDFFSVSSPLSHVTRCVQHDIYVLNLPSNLTHLLQVADVSVFGPFKTYMTKTNAVREHEGRSVVAPHEVASLTREPWEKAATPTNIIAVRKNRDLAIQPQQNHRRHIQTREPPPWGRKKKRTTTIPCPSPSTP
jgi:hypothetical protein